LHAANIKNSDKHNDHQHADDDIEI
jgi:hypothetical protein